MAEEPIGGGLAWLLAAKAVCCGGLLLAATGAFSMGSLAGWLLEGGLAWLAGAALAIALLYLLRRHRAEATAPRDPEQESGSRSAT